ncbi:helix-turn-helix domain-containing protein [Shimazuella sp. AN120528]|uniref:helix-turn-helix domain-containing protein n=1 Tax=Shimazuella soli TaxID=1892854 RepID=UPI001F10AE4C|nr:helix-turn-helix transcriptional regulator [Shimazuella soli]MCH5585137.1 helix-turn-helix domain-containing protein [Shimazuella soli]
MRRDIVGAILAKERKRLNLNQQEVADKMELGKTTISYMERGLPTVGDDRYIQYAEFLGIAEELFGVVDEATERERSVMEELLHIEDIITGNPKEASTLLAELDVNMFQTAKVFATFLKGRIAFVLQKRKDSRDLLNKALLGLDECPDLAHFNLHAICLNDLGRLAFYEEDYQSALEHTEKAINVFQENGERIYYKPYLYLNKVIYLEELGRDEEACRELEFLYEHIDKIKENIAPVIQIYEQFATLLLKTGQPLKALEYAQKGHQVAWKNRQYRRLFSIWSLMGEIYVALGRLNEAKIRYRKAIAYREYVSDYPDRIGITYLNYGKLLIALGESQSSEEQISNAVKSFRKSKNKEINLIEALITLGHLKSEMDLILEADKILSSGNNSRAVSVDIFLKMCDFYENKGNEQKFKQYQNLMYRKLKEGASNEKVWERRSIR